MWGLARTPMQGKKMPQWFQATCTTPLYPVLKAWTDSTEGRVLALHESDRHPIGSPEHHQE